MKDRNKHILLSSIAVSGLLLTGCDLDKFPESGILTEDQKEEVINKRPNLIIGEVNAMPAKLITFETISDDSYTYHSDYGVPAVAQQLDFSGQDMVATISGYNWFSRAQSYADRDYSRQSGAEFIWKIFYNHMNAANNVLSLVGETPESDDMKKYRGQALAARAYDYLNLIQTFQFTYAGHENEKGVPLVLETMTAEEMQNNPRATVKEVYDQILKDLDEAVTLLEGFDNGSNKDQIDQAVVYGLRARANLLMQNWTAAAADAEKAIAGGTPYSLEQVSTPTFNSASAGSWLWGCMITPDNDVVQTGIINWPSHLCSFTGNGYTTLTGAFRSVSSKLYDLIPDTDIRKQWFVSPENTSALIDNQTVGGKSVFEYFGLLPYVNTKFGAYQSVFANTTNASDWPLMRVEEMILIKAEGEAMSGNLPAAKSTLESFVKEYRNPSFVSMATSPQEMQEEIWLQRRMELWGEGFSLFDLLRLKKPVERKETNYHASVQFNIPAESQILIYRIPQVEVQVNDGISETDNNPAAPLPSL